MSTTDKKHAVITMGKLMERFEAKELAQDLERRNVLPPNQGEY